VSAEAAPPKPKPTSPSTPRSAPTDVAPPAAVRPQSSRQRRYLRSRQALAAIALVVAVAYLIWRALFTLNPDALLLSWFLLVLEAHAILGIGLATYSLWDTRPLEPASRRLPEGRTAVFITTYDEAVEIVLPTVAAASELEGDVEVWLLDDGARPAMRELADRFRISYIGRQDSAHAKAGNLNNALDQVDADFVAILDADHVPHPDFLRHTLPYFNDPGLAVVQTPQDFYNADSFEHGALRGDGADEKRLHYTEQSLFYRAIQPGKNRWGAAFWCGTPAVLRTAALRDVGGVATDSVTEDLMTTIRLHRAGWRTVFHDEVLARGLAAPTAAEYRLQRRRWGIGAIQTLRHERPLSGPGLSWRQRLSYAATFLAWFDALRIIGLLLVPPLVLLTGAAPLDVPLATFATFFSVYFVMQLAAMQALGRGTFRPIQSSIFELVRLDASLTALVSGYSGRNLTFEVTPKGRSQEPRIPIPRLLLLFVAVQLLAAGWYLASLLGMTATSYTVPGIAHGAAAWLLVNLALLTTAVGRVRRREYRPERRRSQRMDVDAPGAVDGLIATFVDISTTGTRAVVWSTEARFSPGEDVVAHVKRGAHGTARLRARVVTATRPTDGPLTLHLDFLEGQHEARALAVAGLYTGERPTGADETGPLLRLAS
jgi:cellulose synthase (UDP-forming)